MSPSCNDGIGLKPRTLSLVALVFVALCVSQLAREAALPGTVGYVSTHRVNSVLQTSVAHSENTAAVLKEHSVNGATLASISARWDAAWSADASAADLNVAHLSQIVSLVARAEAGDLEATVDLVSAATWCLAGGPLVNIAELVGDARRPCVERFGDTLASRDKLERATFVWVLQLASAGVDDATLYASALLRGASADMLGGVDADPATRETQRALLIGQLQTLAERGSADAASELHGHWRGDSALQLHDERWVAYYAALTERLDPARSLAAAAP